MAGRTDCCRYEATLDELIDGRDDGAGAAQRRASIRKRFRDLIVETARRIDERAADNRPDGPLPRRDRRTKD